MKTPSAWMYREVIHCGQGQFYDSDVRVSLIEPSDRAVCVAPLYRLTDEELLRLDACKARARRDMSRKLRLFNGRGHGKYMGYHFYRAAYSVADAERVMQEALGFGQWKNEINVYYSQDCWGDYMKGVTPERGLWACAEPGGTPFRVVLDTAGGDARE